MVDSLTDVSVEAFFIGFSFLLSHPANLSLSDFLRFTLVDLLISD